MREQLHHYDEILFELILCLEQHHKLPNILKQQMNIRLFSEQIKSYQDHNEDYRREEILDRENVDLLRNNRFVLHIRY